MEKVIEIHSKLSGPGLQLGNVPVGGRIQYSRPQVPAQGSSCHCRLLPGPTRQAWLSARFDELLETLVEPSCARRNPLQCLSSCHRSACLQEAVKSLAPGPQLAGWGQGVNSVLRSGLFPGPRNPPPLLQTQWGVQGTPANSGECRAPYFLALPLQHQALGTQGAGTQPGDSCQHTCLR